MSNSTIPQKLKKLVAEELNVNVKRITSGASLVDDLGADDLDLVELVMAVEEDFGIEIRDEEADGFKTVGDIADFLKTKKPFTNGLQKTMAHA
jgi:acyl carrier protein